MMIIIIIIIITIKTFSFSCYTAQNEFDHRSLISLDLQTSVFSRIWTEYEEMRSIFPHLVGMQEIMDQNNFKYRRFLRSALFVLMKHSHSQPLIHK